MIKTGTACSGLTMAMMLCSFWGWSCVLSTWHGPCWRQAGWLRIWPPWRCIWWSFPISWTLNMTKPILAEFSSCQNESYDEHSLDVLSEIFIIELVHPAHHMICKRPMYHKGQGYNFKFIVINGDGWQCICVLFQNFHLLQVDGPLKIFAKYRVQFLSAILAKKELWLI